MTTSTLITFAMSIVCLSLLFYLFDYLYRSYRVDLFRFYVFRARDRLFLDADRGVISFDHPAYGMTRQMLNGMIRFGHEISLWRAIVMALTLKKWDRDDARKEFWQRYSDALESLSPAGRKAVMRAMMEANLCAISHVLHTSLITFPFIVTLKWMLRTHWKMKRVGAWVYKSKFVRPAQDLLDREAYLVGDGDAAPVC